MQISSFCRRNQSGSGRCSRAARCLQSKTLNQTGSPQHVILEANFAAQYAITFGVESVSHLVPSMDVTLLRASPEAPKPPAPKTDPPEEVPPPAPTLPVPPDPACPKAPPELPRVPPPAWAGSSFPPCWLGPKSSAAPSAMRPEQPVAAKISSASGNEMIL